MDTIDTPTTDIVIIDEAALVEDSTNDSFGKEIGKTLVTSAATTAGMVVGTLLIGFAVGKFQQFRANRTSKKDVVEGEIVTETIETPTTEN